MEGEREDERVDLGGEPSLVGEPYLRISSGICAANVARSASRDETSYGLDFACAGGAGGRGFRAGAAELVGAMESL